VSTPRVCAVVPTHNHWAALPDVLARLRAEGLAVFVIDDGSAEPARSVIAALAASWLVKSRTGERNRVSGNALARK